MLYFRKVSVIDKKNAFVLPKYSLNRHVYMGYLRCTESEEAQWQFVNFLLLNKLTYVNFTDLILMTIRI